MRIHIHGGINGAVNRYAVFCYFLVIFLTLIPRAIVCSVFAVYVPAEYNKNCSEFKAVLCEFRVHAVFFKICVRASEASKNRFSHHRFVDRGIET